MPHSSPSVLQLSLLRRSQIWEFFPSSSRPSSISALLTQPFSQVNFTSSVPKTLLFSRAPFSAPPLLPAWLMPRKVLPPPLHHPHSTLAVTQAVVRPCPPNLSPASLSKLFLEMRISSEHDGRYTCSFIGGLPPASPQSQHPTRIRTNCENQAVTQPLPILIMSRAVARACAQ